MLKMKSIEGKPIGKFLRQKVAEAIGCDVHGVPSPVASKMKNGNRVFRFTMPGWREERLVKVEGKICVRRLLDKRADDGNWYVDEVLADERQWSWEYFIAVEGIEPIIERIRKKFAEHNFNADVRTGMSCANVGSIAIELLGDPVVPALPPALELLLRKLPKPGEPFPAEARQRWLTHCRNLFDLIYEDDEGK
jgi:hypothetical protein